MKTWWVNTFDLKDSPGDVTDVSVVSSTVAMVLTERIKKLESRLAEALNNYKDNMAVDKGVGNEGEVG